MLFRSELKLMYQNLHQQGLGGFAAEVYWSSSEASSNNAWNQNFFSGNQSNGSKFGFYPVRAARAFGD